MPSETWCEAHRVHRAEETIETENGTRMQLCKAATRAVGEGSLEPLEWFNLAGLHTVYEYALSAELYDEEGNAQRPSRKRKSARAAAPTFSEVKGDLARLLDFAFSRANPTEDDAVIAALKKHPAKDFLAALEQRTTYFPDNVFVEAIAVGLAGEVLGARAEDWVRALWLQRGKGEGKLSAYAKALSQSLPHEEAFALITAELDALTPAERRVASFALAPLRSEKTLAWLEQNVSEPVTPDWGRVAAASDFSWKKAREWLERGRPMSLVALDAIYETRGPSEDRSPWMNRTLPKMSGAPPIKDAKAVLESHAQRDAVPRVRKAVAAILKAWSEIGPKR